LRQRGGDVFAGVIHGGPIAARTRAKRVAERVKFSGGLRACGQRQGQRHGADFQQMFQTFLLPGLTPVTCLANR